MVYDVGVHKISVVLKDEYYQGTTRVENDFCLNCTSTNASNRILASAVAGLFAANVTHTREISRQRASRSIMEPKRNLHNSAFLPV